MRRRLSLGWIVVAVVPVALGSASGACREATQLQVRVYTNVPYTPGMTVAVWAGPDIRTLTAPVAKVTSPWGSDGTIGSLAVVPAGRKDGPIAVRVALALPGRDAETCGQNGDFSRCIVARRSLSYLEHHGLDIPVGLFATCEAKPCDDDTTCNASGQCVTARIDPATCSEASPCLPPGDPAPGGGVIGGQPEGGPGSDGGVDAVGAPPPPPRDLFMSDLAPTKGSVTGTARIKPAADESAIEKYRLTFPGGSVEIARGSTAEVAIGPLASVPDGARIEARSVGLDGQLSSPVSAPFDNVVVTVALAGLTRPVIDTIDDRIVGLAKLADPGMRRLDCPTVNSCTTFPVGIPAATANEINVLALAGPRLLFGHAGGSFFRCSVDSALPCAGGESSGLSLSALGTYLDAPRNEVVAYAEGALFRLDASTIALKRTMDVPVVSALRAGVWAAPNSDEVLVAGSQSVLRCTGTLAGVGAPPAPPVCTSHDVSAGRPGDALGYLPRIYVRGNRVHIAGVRASGSYDAVAHTCDYPLAAAPTCTVKDVGVGGGAISEATSGRYGDSVLFDEGDTLYVAHRGPAAALTLHSCRLPSLTCTQYPLEAPRTVTSPSLALDRKNRRLVVADNDGLVYLDAF